MEKINQLEVKVKTFETDILNNNEKVTDLEEKQNYLIEECKER